MAVSYTHLDGYKRQTLLILVGVPTAGVIYAGAKVISVFFTGYTAMGIEMCIRDRASLLSIYLVGFQLPLSGAVLALPEQVEGFIRPFISAYWAWS